MPNLTSDEIKTRLDLIDWAANSLPIIRVFKSPQTEGRERYPRIDIENKSKQNSRSDVLIDTLEQRVLIHVHYRIKGEASDEEDKIGQIETLVTDQLNGWILNGAKINIENFEWDRQTRLRPAKHIESILTVFVTDTTSQTGVGVTGKSITVDIGSISGLQILGETGTKGRDSVRKFNYDASNVNNVSGGKIGNRFFEYEYNVTRYNVIDALIEAKAYITVTFHETGQADTVLTAKPVNQSSTTRYDGLKTTIVALELK